MESLPTFNDVYKTYNFLYTCINNAVSISIPVYKPFSYKTRLPAQWWDPEDCDKALSKRR